MFMGKEKWSSSHIALQCSLLILRLLTFMSPCLVYIYYCLKARSPCHRVHFTSCASHSRGPSPQTCFQVYSVGPLLTVCHLINRMPSGPFWLLQQASWTFGWALWSAESFLWRPLPSSHAEAMHLSHQEEFGTCISWELGFPMLLHPESFDSRVAPEAHRLSRMHIICS